jgi:transposase
MELEQRGVRAVWRRSVAEALAVGDLLDERIAPLEAELRPLAQADRRVQLLMTIPDVGELLGLTMAAEIGDVARFSTPRKLIGYAGWPRASRSRGRARAPARCPRPLVALGSDRGSPISVAPDQPLASPLCRRQAAHRQGQSA